MAEDPFKDLKEAPYPLFVAPRPYSFDLNEDMIKILRNECNTEGVISELAEAIKGKAGGEIEEIGKRIFEEYGQNWMRKTIQMGDEYPDRTIEMVLETVDHSGNQFLIFPHVIQRFVEIAYLSNQKFTKLPVTLNNAYEFSYRIPQCAIFNAVKEKCGEEVANLMTCRNACLKALDILRDEVELETINEMVSSTAEDSYCEFSIKKL